MTKQVRILSFLLAAVSALGFLSVLGWRYWQPAPPPPPALAELYQQLPIKLVPPAQGDSSAEPVMPVALHERSGDAERVLAGALVIRSPETAYRAVFIDRSDTAPAKSGANSV